VKIPGGAFRGRALPAVVFALGHHPADVVRMPWTTRFYGLPPRRTEIVAAVRDPCPPVIFEPVRMKTAVTHRSTGTGPGGTGPW